MKALKRVIAAKERVCEVAEDNCQIKTVTTISKRKTTKRFKVSEDIPTALAKEKQKKKKKVLRI